MSMTILLWKLQTGWLACWWEPNRSSPYDVKFGDTPGQAVDRLDLSPDPEDAAPLVEAA